MIVLHVVVRTVEDYVAKRGAHRRAHLERLQGLRAAGICLLGGPSPDGATADLVYRLQRPEQLTFAIEEDPYWTGGLWTTYTPRSFAEFVEPFAPAPLVVDGSRRVTIVEGPCADHGLGQLALVQLRGEGRLHLGGFFSGGQTWAVMKSAEAAEAIGWLEETGQWAPSALTTRSLLHVL